MMMDSCFGISFASPSPTMRSLVWWLFWWMRRNAVASVGRFFSRAILPQNPITMLFFWMPTFSLARAFDRGGVKSVSSTPRGMRRVGVVMWFLLSERPVLVLGKKRSVQWL